MSLARRTASAALGAVAACLVAGSALAGDPLTVGRPAAAASAARCSALGEGFFAVSGSSACIKISGYVAAGAVFGGVLPASARNFGPFGAAPAAPLRTRSGVSADARFDTPMGPGRLYIQLGRDGLPQP